MKPFEELFFKAGPDCSPGPAFYMSGESIRLRVFSGFKDGVDD